ncbi:hypothetical protein JCM10212_004259 [Sporobolomyces blumeae]
MVASSVIRFQPFDPDDDKQVETLIWQRTLCGWGIDSVEKWRSLVRRNVKGLYWIHPADREDPGPRFRYPLPDLEPLNLEPNKTGPPAPHPDFRPIGHVSLDWEDYEGDESLAKRDEGICTIASFYILASQQGTGLGSVVMRELEEQARESGGKTITLNTLCGIAAQEPEFWKKMGMEFDPNRRLMEPWYTRLGYKAYKRMPRYPTLDRDGNMYKVQAVFMRKDLV